MSRYAAGYLFCILPILLLRAGPVAAQTPPVKLAVVASAGAPAGDPSTYHFQPEEADNGQGISHVFVLRNDTDKPVKIVRIDASCSCTTAVLQPGGATQSADTGNVVLAPGQQARLLVTVGIGDAAAGELEKTVWVRIDGQADPAATLHVTGTIDPPVMFVPSTLDFGVVSAGKAHGAAFLVGFSPRALLANARPAPVSPAPYIRIGPMPLGKNAQRAFPSTYRVYGYSVTIDSDAPMGPIDGAVALGQAAPEQSPGTALVLGSAAAQSQPIDPSPAATASLPIQGTIAGDLSAQPSTAIFGTIAAGSTASVQMTISSHSKQNLAGMRFTADQPWLSAQVVGPAGEPGTWDIRLDIAATAPAGAQSAHVIGSLPSGERLLIPIMAYIVAEGR